MSDNPPSDVMSKIAYYQGRQDEVPNQELARELALSRDLPGIQEVVDHLWDKNQNVQSDCVKVLYEIGYIDPELIAPYTEQFLKLLDHKNNRMVWGAMIALGCVANLTADQIYEKVDRVIKTVESGSVITTVWGVKTLAQVAATGPDRQAKIMPFLLNILQTCIPRDVATHAENLVGAVDASALSVVLAVLEERAVEMSPSQLSRLKKAMKNLQKGVER